MAERLRTTERIGSIDMAKGVACLIMVMAHQTSFRFGDMHFVDWFLLSLPGFFSAVLFFFASGANVINFNDRYGDAPGFHSVRFYLSAAAVLFLLGYIYQINRVAFGMWTLFHGIAASTALTFLLIRLRLPNWLLMIVAFAFYGLYLRFWMAGVPDMESMRLIADSTKQYAASHKWVMSLKAHQRWLYIHFSLLPWVSYVLAGAATFRSIRLRPALRPVWLGFYAVLIVAGVLSRYVYPHPWLHASALDLFLRHFPVLFAGWMGASGLLIVVADYLYKNASEMKTGLGRSIWTFLEFLGRESFVFLIWHWIVLTTINLVWTIALAGAALGVYPYSMYLPWLLAEIAIVLTMPFAVRLGEHWRTSPGFAIQATVVIAVGCLLAIGAIAGGKINVGIYLSFGPCLAFAYSYGRIRIWLRKRCTVKPIKKSLAAATN